MKIKDLQEPYKSMALKNQKEQRGDVNENEYLNYAFDWDYSFENFEFWDKVFNGETPPIPKSKNKLIQLIRDIKLAMAFVPRVKKKSSN